MSNYTIDPKTGKSYFEINGLKLEIVQVAPLLINKLNKMYPAPKPPKVKVEVGENEFVFMEDPDNDGYRNAYATWQNEQSDKHRSLLLNKGVNIELTPGQRQQVDQWRAFWLDTYGQELGDSDEFCYLSYVLLTKESDYTALTEAILGRSNPTEAAVANALETFPD